MISAKQAKQFSEAKNKSLKENRLKNIFERIEIAAAKGATWIRVSDLSEDEVVELTGLGHKCDETSGAVSWEDA